MIHLQNTNLIAIPVPEDAEYIHIPKCRCKCVSIAYLTKEDVLKVIKLDVEYKKYELIGYATSEHISFDVEPFVEHKEINGYDYNGLTVVDIYRNYFLPEKDYEICCDQFGLPEDSFYSLLQASGVYFVNPYGEKVETLGHEVDLSLYEFICDWQQAQKQTSPKFAILKQL